MQCMDFVMPYLSTEKVHAQMNCSDAENWKVIWQRGIENEKWSRRLIQNMWEENIASFVFIFVPQSETKAG